MVEWIAGAASSMVNKVLNKGSRTLRRTAIASHPISVNSDFLHLSELALPPGIRAIGSPLPLLIQSMGRDYIVLDEDAWESLGLRRPTGGTRYVRVDNQILRMSQATR